MAYGRIGRLGKEKLQKYANEVNSIAELSKKLNYAKNCGGVYYIIKKYLQLYEIDTSHWTGQGWSKNKQLKDWAKYKKNDSIKKHLINQRGHKCEMCANSAWLEKPITLEVHHVNGVRTDNLLENLQLVCPNCHATTDTWRGRNCKK